MRRDSGRRDDCERDGEGRREMESVIGVKNKSSFC